MNTLLQEDPTRHIPLWRLYRSVYDNLTPWERGGRKYATSEEIHKGVDEVVALMLANGFVAGVPQSRGNFEVFSDQSPAAVLTRVHGDWQESEDAPFTRGFGVWFRKRR